MASRSKKMIVISILVLAILAVGGICLFVNQREPLRYEGIQNVTFKWENPPFDEFTPTNQEINELLDCLSALDLSDYEVHPDVPIGTWLYCTIETENASFAFRPLSPYLVVGETTYRLGDDAELFQIVEKIAQKRSSSDPFVPDPRSVR